ncbi:MAG: TonB family protein [Deltaproteobacteria bacterium]|nr:TonB family protein [Deltaproteobacteria bacterium]
MTEETHPEQRLECPVCGGKALPGEVRCNYCGARLRVDSAEASEAAPSSQIAHSGDLATSRNPSGPQEFGDESVYERPETPKKRHRLAKTLGFSGAAIIALGAGAWLALYLSKNNRPPQAPATPAAIATSAPIVELAKETPLRIQGDVAGTAPRNLDALLKVFNDSKAGLANVYGNALSSDPSMKDGMAVRLHILPNGSVDNGAVSISTSGNPSFDAEVVEAMTSWKFAAANGAGMSADYRVIFAPSASAASAVESDLNNKLANLSPNEPPEYAFSPSGATPAAVAAANPSAVPTTAPTGGASAVPSSSVAVTTPAPASEPTMLAALPPAASVPAPEPKPTRMMPAPTRVHHHRRPPREITALPPPKPPLIQRVKNELHGNRRLRRVQAYTNGSVVTIFGKVFDDNYRMLAERTVRNTDGVSAVINNLTTDTQRWEQNRALIAQALQNAGLTDVHVKVIGRDAYLSGQVKTNLDRERAVTVAQSAAPIRVRENLITVAIGNMFGF